MRGGVRRLLRIALRDEHLAAVGQRDAEVAVLRRRQPLGKHRIDLDRDDALGGGAAA